MYLFLKFYSDPLRFHFIVIVFLLLFSLLFNICFVNEAFCMEPDTTMDYYGKKEYIGPDPYNHFHDPIKNSHISPVVNTEVIQHSCGTGDLYGTNPPYERDWYAENHYNTRTSVHHDNSFTLVIKRRAYWYVWKMYSTEYNNYKDFKKAWNPKNSIRKEIINDIKNAFLKRK